MKRKKNALGRFAWVLTNPDKPGSWPMYSFSFQRVHRFRWSAQTAPALVDCVWGLVFSFSFELEWSEVIDSSSVDVHFLACSPVTKLQACQWRFKSGLRGYFVPACRWSPVPTESRSDDLITSINSAMLLHIKTNYRGGSILAVVAHDCQLVFIFPPLTADLWRNKEDCPTYGLPTSKAR